MTRLQRGPLPVVNKVMTSIKWPYTWVTGVITLLIGAITPFITGRETPCTSSGNFVNSVSFSIFPWEANMSSTTARRCIVEEHSAGFG